MGPAVGLLPKHRGNLYCGFLSYHDLSLTGHRDLNVSGQPHPRGPSLKTRVHLQQVWTKRRKFDRK